MTPKVEEDAVSFPWIKPVGLLLRHTRTLPWPSAPPPRGHCVSWTSIERPVPPWLRFLLGRKYTGLPLSEARRYGMGAAGRTAWGTPEEWRADFWWENLQVHGSWSICEQGGCAQRYRQRRQGALPACVLQDHPGSTRRRPRCSAEHPPKCACPRTVDPFSMRSSSGSRGAATLSRQCSLERTHQRPHAAPATRGAPLN